MLSTYPDIGQVVPAPEHARINEAFARLQGHLIDNDRRIVDVRYITGRRRAFVFEIRARNGSESQSYFMKVGVRADLEITDYVSNEAQNTYTVHHAMRSLRLLRVSEPVAFYEDLACFVLKGHAGKRLDELIVSSCRGARDTADFHTAQQYCELAADWLTAFQSEVKLPALPEHNAADALRARLEREIIVLSLSSNQRITEKQCRELRSTADSLLAGFSAHDFEACARHNDFAPWNILCDAGTICVIDYADLRIGSAYFDAYQFVDAMHVLSNKLMIRSQRVLELKRHFVGRCAPIQSASPAAEQFFRLLHKLIRVNAVFNNSATRFPMSFWNRHLRNRYLRSVDNDLQYIPLQFPARPEI